MKKNLVVPGLIMAGLLAFGPLAPVSASADVTTKIGDQELKVKLFGFSQLTFEGGDGFGADDGPRIGADRIRLGYTGSLGKAFSKLQLDFMKADTYGEDATGAKNTTGDVGIKNIIKDAVVGYKVHDAAKVSLGIFKTPIGMDFNTSGKKLDLTKRGLEKQLVLERAPGLMVSGRKIAGGFGYDVGFFNPTKRSSVVTGGTAGDQIAWSARVMYDLKKMLHVEASYGISEEAGGAGTEDYKVWDLGVTYRPMKNLTLKAEYISGSDLKGVNGMDQTVWYLHAGYRFIPTMEGVIRHYQADEDSSNTDLSNTVFGLNIFLNPAKKEASRIQVNYVLAGGDEGSFGGQGANYRDDVYLVQYQFSF